MEAYKYKIIRIDKLYLKQIKTAIVKVTKKIIIIHHQGTDV